MERAIVYIDGFNLYFGLRQSRLDYCRWLNVQQLAQNILKPQQQLMWTNYFTARITRRGDKQRRQLVYLEALETLTEFSTFYGKYLSNTEVCRGCGRRHERFSEKMTDVNIAVELLADAYQDKFDTAVLISGDSDLTTPIMRVRQLFPEKRVVVAFPPERFSVDLSNAASAYFVIGRNNIVKSVFPPEVQKADGFVLRCPSTWMRQVPTPTSK